MYGRKQGRVEGFILAYSLLHHEEGMVAWVWSSWSHCKCSQKAERSACWGSAKFLFCIQSRTLAHYVVPPTLRVDLPFSVNTDTDMAENPSRTCPEGCSHDSKLYQVDNQDQPPKVKHMKSFKNNKLSQNLKHCTQDSDPVRDHPELNKNAIILNSDWSLWVMSRTLTFYHWTLWSGSVM